MGGILDQWAQYNEFVESGLKRLDLGEQTVVSHGVQDDRTEVN